jgi:hypothetical protein
MSDGREGWGRSISCARIPPYAVPALGGQAAFPARGHVECRPTIVERLGVHPLLRSHDHRAEESTPAEPPTGSSRRAVLIDAGVPGLPWGPAIR